MKNKTKIVADVSQAQPYNITIDCDKCKCRSIVKVYPALGANFFECRNCNAINKIATQEMDICL